MPKIDINRQAVIDCADRLVEHGLDRLEADRQRVVDRLTTRVSLGAGEPIVPTRHEFFNGRVLLYVRELTELAKVIGCSIHSVHLLYAVQREMVQMLPDDLGDVLSPVLAFLPKAANAPAVGTEPGIIMVDMVHEP